LVSGCAETRKVEKTQAPSATESAQQSELPMYEGEITSVSERANSISITVGKGDTAKVMMVKSSTTRPKA